MSNMQSSLPQAEVTGTPSEIDGGPVPHEQRGPRTLGEAFRLAALRASPRDLVFVQKDGIEVCRSFEDLLAEARSVRSGLDALGLKPGDHAILQLVANQDVLAAFWGCVLGGVVPVIAAVPPSLAETSRPLEQLRHVWELIERPAVITSSDLKQPMRSPSALPGSTLRPRGRFGSTATGRVRRNRPALGKGSGPRRL